MYSKFSVCSEKQICIKPTPKSVDGLTHWVWWSAAVRWCLALPATWHTTQDRGNATAANLLLLPPKQTIQQSDTHLNFFPGAQLTSYILIRKGSLSHNSTNFSKSQRTFVRDWIVGLEFSLLLCCSILHLSPRFLPCQLGAPGTDMGLVSPSVPVK